MIRMGIIGRNFVVDWMMEALQAEPEYEVTAVYSRREDTGREFAAKYGIPTVFTRLEDLADCPDVDAVYVASPVSCHYAQSLLMLQHGKHVLCEKPVTSTAAEAAHLVRTAKEKGVVFLEAMRPVHDDALQIIRDNLPRIGVLRQVIADFSQYSSRYDRIRAGETGINTFNPALSNAAIMDMGCYCIHSIVSLFGKPLSVQAQSIHLDSGFEAAGVVMMGYPGFTATATYSKVSQQVHPTVFVGEDGAILADGLNFTRSLRLQHRGGETEELPFVQKQPNNMVMELRHFADGIVRGASMEKYQRDSILTMEIIDEARRQTGTRFPADDITITA